MAGKRTRNAALLIKTQAAEGVAESMSGSADGLTVENPRWQLNPNLVQANEATGTLDPFESRIPAGMKVSMTCDVYLKGSGTAGTAPRLGRFLTAAGFAEVVTATAVPSSPEACGAGGSTTTAQLGASAGTTAQQYRGMPAIFEGDVEGLTTITDYTTGKIATLANTFAAIDADTDYQIPVNVLYKPTSVGSDIKILTAKLFRDGVRILMSDVRLSFQLMVDAAGVGKISITMQGILVDYDDESMPVLPEDTVPKPVFRGATGGHFSIQRVPVAIRQFMVDIGNALVATPNPNAAEGFDGPIITARNTTGRVDPNRAAKATVDYVAGIRAGTKYIMHARWGSVAGNRIALTCPYAQVVDEGDEDAEGVAKSALQFDLNKPDAGIFICFF